MEVTRTMQGTSTAERTNDELLEALKTEREKYTKSDTTLMLDIVDELITRGVYKATPTTEKFGYSFLQMAEGYGVDWHIWKGHLECPECKADWRNHESGPPFKREIGVVMRDRVTAWQCPDCHAEIER